MPEDLQRGDWHDRALIAAGIAAPVVYAATVIIGGALRPGYSHIANAISELIERGEGAALEPAFLLYNLLVLLFGGGLLLEAQFFGRARQLSAIMVAAGGALGLVMAWFPQDPLGTPMTVTGAGHVVLAAFMSITSIAAVIADAVAWWHMDRRRAAFSARCAGLIVISGLLAAASAATAGPFMGLFERMTIGSYLFWVLVTAIRSLRRHELAHHV